MGDRSRTTRSSGLRFLLRLLSVVASLFVLSVTQRAAATTGSPPVPMCGERNESIEAPPIFRPTVTGELRVGSCQAPDQLEHSSQVPLAPERVIVQERPERALGYASLCLARPVTARLNIDAAARVALRPGFVGTPFRPPRA